MTMAGKAKRELVRHFHHWLGGTGDVVEIRRALKYDMRLEVNPQKRRLYLIAGHICLVLGVIGLMLPLIPTSPFILMAAFCYARGSRHFYVWLATNRAFGPYVRTWQRHGVVPLNAKIFGAFVIVVMVTSTIIFIIPGTAFRVIFGIIGISGLIYLLSLPHRVREERQEAPNVSPPE